MHGNASNYVMYKVYKSLQLLSLYLLIPPWWYAGISNFVQQYFILRTKAIQQQKETGPHPYPHKFSVSLSLAAFIEQYQHLECGQQLEDEVLNIAGEWSGPVEEEHGRKENLHCA